jgi:PAS domain S-box-containing protein
MPIVLSDAFRVRTLLTPELTSLIAEKAAALRTEAGLAAILNGIGEGFYAVDREWRFVLFNDEAARYFCRAPADVIGRILWDTFPGSRETGLGQLFHKVMASRETIRSETESVIFGGRWLSYRLFPLGDGMGVVFRDITDRKSAEEQRDLLVKELEHRVKNTLSLVQSIAAQTFRNSGVDASVQRAFEARLITLSNVHGVLTQRGWDSADLHDVVSSALRPHAAVDRERFTVAGPALRLGPKSAVALSMAVHELCTNAIKYGALSADSGHVDIDWSDADGRLRWRWRERGGPPVAIPTRTGFGSRMIERALAMQLSGTVTLDYQATGLVCTIDAPMAAIRDS